MTIDPAFEKWVKSQEAKGKDWEGRVNREYLFQEFSKGMGLGKRFVGMHCPWCRMRTLYKRTEELGYHCTSCFLDFQIECLSPEKLEKEKLTRKVERKLAKYGEESLTSEERDLLMNTRPASTTEESTSEEDE